MATEICINFPDFPIVPIDCEPHTFVERFGCLKFVRRNEWLEVCDLTRDSSFLKMLRRFSDRIFI
ncbi:MAG: hypothetical protein ACI9BW_004007 [Gammaproteobacteria bacterium]|jgi:hypothetical protein